MWQSTWFQRSARLSKRIICITVSIRYFVAKLRGWNYHLHPSGGSILWAAHHLYISSLSYMIIYRRSSVERHDDEEAGNEYNMTKWVPYKSMNFGLCRCALTSVFLVHDISLLFRKFIGPLTSIKQSVGTGMSLPRIFAPRCSPKYWFVAASCWINYNPERCNLLFWFTSSILQSLSSVKETPSQRKHHSTMALPNEFNEREIDASINLWWV